MIPRFVFICGGTGGHVIPALAVAEELRELCPMARIRFVGGRRGIEGRLVPRAGFSLTRYPAAGMRGLGLPGTVRFAVSGVIAAALSVGFFFRHRPHLVLATGGYATAAPALIAAVLGRPLWLQEQNSAPGSTNRWLAPLAERVYVAYDAAREALSAAREVLTCSNPVRIDLVDRGRQPATAEDYERFGLEEGVPTLLVFGGSRGAASLNAALREGWPALAKRGPWQLLLQSGESEFESTRVAVAREYDGAPRARVLDFIDDMAAAYRIADLAVCRAGASTLAELEAVGLPALLVPFPHATDDHQRHNARAVVEGGAAIMIDDAELDGARLVEELSRVAPGTEAGVHLRRVASESTVPRAARRIALDMLARCGATEVEVQK
jgi:UDP-N-acetylglucosamine--N-acetylmuramyl-(pentapeptide) pyrophosphoryl-undecaprenol N-acetylglucosamine transferase